MRRNDNENLLKEVLIASVTPYFLDKGFLWFMENRGHIIASLKTQSFFQDNILIVENGGQYHFSNILRKLDELGYEKVQQIGSPGEFSRQGGIIEVFPINVAHAIRLDFLGNSLEKIDKLSLLVPDEKKSREFLKKRLKSQKLFSDLRNLKAGDYLVHLDHGVGRFLGIKQSETGSYYILDYALGDKLYVPVGLERKLSRYVGFHDPRISRLGSWVWQTTKRKMKEEAEKFAQELLSLYAIRTTVTRTPYDPADEFESHLENTFPYEETPDQKEAIADIFQDLQQAKPMDRLVCGDVGFGKTEVALRAMVKVVKSGFQAVMLCPTTILAHQHYQTIKERVQGLPITVSLLTRLQSHKEQKESLEKIRNKSADIIIGTHRLFSKDINPHLFREKNAGLLVIDDEQRFGVKQKEHFKQMRSGLDVLSLSATPIPRTLHLGLASMKNISLIQTPPLNRSAVKTHIGLRSEKIIQEAIAKEISRRGQVYYLYNRVASIEAARKMLAKISGKAEIMVLHGRMREREIVRVMEEMRHKKAGILLATTIIENGLDLPNFNTIIVHNAELLGLSQAYQVRGRVGRSDKQAYAYFLHGKSLTEKSAMRLAALKEAEELGAGYRLALRDLEIRGAGNILGREQSGNVNKIGLNLYCQMISEAVEKMKMV